MNSRALQVLEGSRPAPHALYSAFAAQVEALSRIPIRRPSRTIAKSTTTRLARNGTHMVCDAPPVAITYDGIVTSRAICPTIATSRDVLA